MSCDPLVEKYANISPYTYTTDNPLKFKYPDGRVIKFANGVTADFKKQFQATIQYLNDKKIAGVVAKLENSKEVIYVQEINTDNMQYDPSTKTIDYNAYSALLTTSGGKQTPALGFLHEASHALQDATNPKQAQKDANTVDKNYDNKEEKRVIEKVETPAAKKAGEGTRKDHRGTPYHVTGPDQIK